MATVAILTGNHLCNNPRVMKEAAALADAEFEVVVLGAWFDPNLKIRDQKLAGGVKFRFHPVLDLTAAGFIPSLNRFAYRLRVRTARFAQRVLGIESRWLFGYAIGRLGRAARDTRADLSIAHSEAGLLVACDLLNAGHRIGVDMEDWFSEDMLPEARKDRPLEMLRRMEREALTRAVHTTCPSSVMSEALAAAYGCREPMVIYNAFPWSDRQAFDKRRRDRRDTQTPSIHWYSQTLGHGRGLDDLIAALPMVNRAVHVHLRGTPVEGFRERLMTMLPLAWRDRVFFHGLVPNDELLSRIAEHDIGFAGETSDCRSRALTATNKILHYLSAGLAVVASATAGQREVAAAAPDAVFLYPGGDGGALAAAINRLLDDPASLRRARDAALVAAEGKFSWERQAPALVDAVRRAMDA